MARIDVNFTELKKNYMTANETNDNLNSIFLKANSELDSICGIVNCSSLTNATSKVRDSITNITKSNVECLNNINEFLKQQVNYYETASETARKSLDDLNSRIDSSLGSINVTNFYSGNIRG